MRNQEEFMENLFGLVGIMVYVALLGLFFVYIAPLAFGLGVAVMIGWVLVNYGRAVAGTINNGGWGDSPVGPEPAYRQYFYRKAYMDYKIIVLDSYRLNRATFELVFTQTMEFFRDDALAFTWPLGVVALLIGCTGLLVAVTVYVVFGAVHLLSLITAGTLALSAAFFFRLLEYGSMAVRRIFMACPHPNCYRKIALPHYVCPTCGAIHKHLYPSTYGTFRRRCKCGKKLPTLFLFGRATLPALCPYDGRPLNAVIGSVRNLHIPIVGGPAAGKSSFLMANMVELNEHTERKEISVEFPENRHRLLFDACREAFLRGEVLTKTAELSPDAFLVKIKGGRGEHRLLYVYDAAGELFERGDVLRGHEYFSYVHCILFLIDPFSLPQIRIDLAREIAGSADSIKPSDEPPMEVYERMVTNLRQLSGAKDRLVPRLAVILTKVDALGVEFQVAEETRTAQFEPKPDSYPESTGVKKWLVAHGEGNLVRAIDNDFGEVRYFACSALGHMPDGKPFVPRGALRPLSWALQNASFRFDAQEI